MTHESGANPAHPYVNSLCCGDDGELYAGGYFFYAGGVWVQHIAVWKGTAWSAFGGGLAWPASNDAEIAGDKTTPLRGMGTASNITLLSVEMTPHNWRRVKK
jgi:hypothetical protein